MDQRRLEDFHYRGVRYVVEKFDPPGEVFPVRYILRATDGSGEYGLMPQASGSALHVTSRKPFTGLRFFEKGGRLVLV